MNQTLGERWRAARPEVAGLHLDSAACSRQSFAAMEAAATHARHEAELGGYVAADAAKPVLDAGRAAFGALTAMSAADVAFTTGSLRALDLLLGSWPPGERLLACLPGEYGPNRALMASHGFTARLLPVDGEGRLDLDTAATDLTANPVDLLHVTAVASHRGVVQPLEQIARLCRDLGVPLVADAAQAFGQVDCAVGADAVYTSSRKWIAGPRGVGVLAVRPALMERLRPGLPPGVGSFEFGEANVAARVGFSVALGEYVAAGPPAVRAALAEVGAMTRAALADVPGWRVVESGGEPCAITTLAPPAGVDPEAVRGWLLAERRIVTTFAGVERAPLELTGPVLRISPHIDTTAGDLATFVDALAAATAAT